MNMSGYGVMTARIGGVSSSLLKSRIVTGDIFGELLGSSYDFTPKVAGGLVWFGPMLRVFSRSAMGVGARRAASR
jgi:hypothetical protein